MPEVAELDNSPALPAIEGSAAAAILLMLLDESEAATILKQLDPDEVRQLAKAMFDTANASEQQIGQALDRFVTRSRDVSALAIGADTRIRTVINEAVGNVRADNILAAVAPIDAEWLQAQAETAAALVADADKARTLWVHPDDAALLADCPLTLAIESDPAMIRGTVRLETSTGWIEHGRAVYLEELRAALGESEAA